MDVHDRYSSLMQDLVAAPGSHEGWHAFLLNLCDALHGTAASFISHSLSDGRTDISVTARTDPQALAEYQQHWHELDPWAHSPSAARLRSGAIVIGDQLISPDEMKQTAYFNDFGRRYGVVQCIAGMFEVSSKTISCVSVNGDEQRPRFGSEDVALLHRLMPHVQRALQIHRRLETAELTATNVTAVLDTLRHGVIFVSATGHVLFVNRTADSILRSRDGLVLDANELRASNVCSTGELRAAINAAVSTTRSADTCDTRTATLLPRPSGRRSLFVLAAPLPRNGVPIGSQVAAAAVFVTDPERPPSTQVEAIRSMFRLTPGEARLVQCLVEGLSLEDASDRLSIQVETARKRVKSVFQKTDTHRQAELISLVLMSTLPGTA